MIVLTGAANARLRGWQRIPLNPNTTTVTTAAQWDWKRRALTVPLEAFVMQILTAPTDRKLAEPNHRSHMDRVSTQNILDFR